MTVHPLPRHGAIHEAFLCGERALAMGRATRQWAAEAARYAECTTVHGIYRALADVFARQEHEAVQQAAYWAEMAEVVL